MLEHLKVQSAEGELSTLLTSEKQQWKDIGHQTWEKGGVGGWGWGCGVRKRTNISLCPLNEVLKAHLINATCDTQQQTLEGKKKKNSSPFTSHDSSASGRALRHPKSNAVNPTAWRKLLQVIIPSQAVNPFREVKSLLISRQHVEFYSLPL